MNAYGIDDPSATWTAVPALDLVEKLVGSGSAGAVDGNLPENQSLLSGSLENLEWLEGGTLTLRWTDTDDLGSDGLYAIDNLNLSLATPVPEPAALWAAALGIGLALAWRRSRRPQLRPARA